MSEETLTPRWNRVTDSLPPEGIEVATKIEDRKGCRNVQPLMRLGNLWWCSPSMYVYYTPTHWGYLSPSPLETEQ
jgi:hypothetical protein